MAKQAAIRLLSIKSMVLFPLLSFCVLPTVIENSFYPVFILNSSLGFRFPFSKGWNHSYFLQLLSIIRTPPAHPHLIFPSICPNRLFVHWKLCHLLCHYFRSIFKVMFSLISFSYSNLFSGSFCVFSLLFLSLSTKKVAGYL